MKGILTVLSLMLSMQACYTTTRNPDSGAYYDGYHEQSVQAEETDQVDSEYTETETLRTGYNYYHYDPYYMDRYTLMDYNRAWYWRSMYRPYYHRNDWRFSFYFGYNSFSPYYSFYDHHFYDPYYYHWQDYYYGNDFYTLYSGYPGRFYQPYSYYPNTYIYVQSGNTTSSNSNRTYGRLSQTSSGNVVSSPNPLPYLIPNIAIIPTKGSKSSGIAERIKRKLGVSIESGNNKKRSGGKSGTVKKTNKESSKSKHTAKPSRSARSVSKSSPPKSSNGSSGKSKKTKKDS